MSAFIKTYPRAKVSRRHPNLNGWVIPGCAWEVETYAKPGRKPQLPSTPPTTPISTHWQDSP